MIIKSIKLENYRRFGSLYLEFPENLIGIIGRNGSGKSTLIEAIGWVLYGNRLGRTDKHDIRSQLAGSKDVCSVEMICLYGGNEYKIVRSLKGVNAVSEAAVYRDGETEPVAVQDRGVNDFIRELLQLDYNSFTASVFARQKDLDKLSSMQPEERRQSINRLIGIDKIDSARSQVRRDKNDKQQFLNGKTSALKDINELEEKLQRTKTQQQQQQEKVDEFKTEVDAKTADLQQARQTFDKINVLRDQHTALDAELGKLAVQLTENRNMQTRHQQDKINAHAASDKYKELAARLDQFASVRDRKQAMDEEAHKETSRQSRDRELEGLRTNLEREQKRSTEFQQQADQLPGLEKQLQELHSREETSETSRRQLQDELTELKANMQSIIKDGEKEKAKLEKLQEIGSDGQCPTCTQRLGDHYATVTGELEAQIASLRVQYRQLQQQEKEKSAALNNAESDLKARRHERETLLKQESAARQAATTLERITEALDSYTKQIQLAEKALAELGSSQYSREQHQALNKQYEELLEIKEKAARYQEQMDRLPRIEQDLSTTLANIERLEKESQELSQKQTALGYRQEAYDTAKKQVDAKERLLDDTRNQWSSAREILAGIASEVKALTREISEQEGIRKEIESTRQEVHYLTALDEHFGVFRTRLANRVRPLIARRASELLTLTTNSRYSLLELDTDYNICIYDGTESFPVQRFSGGEQDLANLCLRIAVSQIVAERAGGAPINFIVLDEIFGSQDAERRDLILHALGKLSEQFRQVFLITHIEPVKDMLPAIIQVEANDSDGSSQAVLV